MRKLLLAALFAATAPTPALAQDAAPFTGLRAEGVVGYDSISDGSDQDSASSNGILYGGQLGYDFQAGRAIVGVEGEVTGSTTDTRADSMLAAGDRFQLDAGRDLYAGARVGVAVSPQAMIYAKGGYTNAKLDVIASDGTTDVEGDFKLDGYRVGAGIEHAIGNSFLSNGFVKLEYRYSNYGDAKFDFDGGATDDFDIDTDRHQIVAGIGIRF